MPTALTHYVSERKQNGIDVANTVKLLGRYAFLEHCAIRALAAWFLRVPAYEDKIAMAYQLWGHAERVDVIRRRLNEMRGGHREANIEPALKRLGEALLHVPDEAAFLAGMRLITQRLLHAYQEHLELADRSANAQECRILRRLIGDLQHDTAWLVRPRTPHVSSWTKQLEVLLAQAGGISGLEPVACASEKVELIHHQRAATLHFDERIKRGVLQPYSQRMEMDFNSKRVAEFRIFFNEFYAAALLATILADSDGIDAPWEFTFDMSHHFWDEVRHAEFGLKRLTELGVQPDEVNLTLFERAESLPVLHRLCYLTLDLEVYFMPRKQPRVKRYEEAGDHRTQLFADVDWSDEGNHVQYGRRWVDHFLKDDNRTVKDLLAEVSAHMAPVLAANNGVPF